MKYHVALTALAALLATPSLAADLAPDSELYPDNTFFPDMTPPKSDWSGFYTGILVGYGKGSATTDTAGTIGSYGASGFLLGASIGYNFQLDSVVLGLEGDITWSGISGEDVCAVGDGFTCSGNIDWLSTWRARAGIALDDILFYATAGLAIAPVDMHVEPAPDGATGQFTDIFMGWTAGLGVEFKLDEQISVKAEYAYVDLGTRTAEAGLVSSTEDTDISATLHTLKIGLNIGF